MLHFARFIVVDITEDIKKKTIEEEEKKKKENTSENYCCPCKDHENRIPSEKSCSIDPLTISFFSQMDTIRRCQIKLLDDRKLELAVTVSDGEEECLLIAVVFRINKQSMN